MTDWPAFAGVAGVVLAALLVLARRSASAVADAPAAGRRTPSISPDLSPDPGPGVLLANVALSQALFGALVLAGAWLTRVPPAALGLEADGVAAALGAGLALGVALYALNAVGTVLFGDRLGDGTALRRALTPATGRGWVALLGVVLPVVAGFEELLFRGVLIGALGAGFGAPVPALVAGSSVAFALGHGAQGRAGMVVTGALGAVLGAAFVLTGSLLAVVVAHYLANTLEFVVHEGLGVDLSRHLRSRNR